MKDKLVRVHTYAIEHKMSTTWVYKLIKDGTLESMTIDKVKFVKIK